MTMDRRRDSADSHVAADDITEIPVKPSKRSFDVAFLMLPDEKMKQRQLKAKQMYSGPDPKLLYNNNDKYEYAVPEEETAKPEPSKTSAPKIIQNSPQKTQVFDDPNLGKVKQSYEADSEYRSKLPYHDQKSAFTKVNGPSKESRLSPNLSISPDLSYQNSLSPSPPILNRQYQSFPPSILPNQIFKTQTTYQNSFVPESVTFSTPSTSLDPFLMKAPGHELLQPNFAKMRPILQYRPEIPYLSNGYGGGFQAQEVLKLGQPDIRNPAAAILSSLLPPSFAALSLPAQNVCAKCNISFRMTSDLVYHMRSHHKNDVANDLSKRRREEKLKCPVCAESFRERHHLTRHMTAHQDKEGDGLEPSDVKKKSYNYNK